MINHNLKLDRFYYVLVKIDIFLNNCTNIYNYRFWSNGYFSSNLVYACMSRKISNNKVSYVSWTLKASID